MVSAKDVVENDLFLIKGIRERNKRAFEIVYKEYYKTLYAIAGRYVLRHEQTEEIVHDVFVKLWNNAEEFNVDHSLKAYLCRCTMNASLNFLKKEKNDEGKLDLYSKTELELEQGSSDDIAQETEALYERLEAAVSQLPPQCRKALMMSKFEKLKQEEIANRMGISIKTVKNHLTYGYNKLRESLYRQ